ncbi:MAG: hypothetical protein JF614_22590 [Acidobacteria bacterium]|nr:hypothetical protein [Acidobacteriota bacterium]
MSERSKRLAWTALLLAALLPLVVSLPAAAQLQFTSPDGKMNAKFGLLSQIQLEKLDNTDGKTTADNIFFRRLRFVGGVKYSDKISIFFDTDVPNLGKGNADGTKNNADLFVQDFTVTYTFAKAFQLDGGLMLLPADYNHTQSAASLMAVDFGPYSFVESVPLTARTGRDYGIQARGYLADDHVEYRGGVFQGFRGKGNTNEFRYAGRLSFWVYGAQTGFFYRGTSLGKNKSLEIGGSFDKQEQYKATSVDLFWDQPVAGGDGITVQGDYNKIDGDIFLPTLPKQTTKLVEAGYYFHTVKLQPYVQLAWEDFDAVTRPDEKRAQGGLNWFIDGHNSTLKLALTHIDLDRAKRRNQVQLQYQFFVF